jgi:nucleotide-binding universal stress UspA family protein
MAEIIVGVDGSPNSLAALRWAHREAALRGDDLVALFAWGFVPPGHAGDGHAFDTGYGSEEAAGALEAAVTGALDGGAAIAEIDLRTIWDVPVRALRAAAAGADMLVVGARGVGGFRGLLLGSVSGQCLHHAPAPLAIVRPDAADGPGTGGRIVVGVDASPSAGRALDWAAGEAVRRSVELEVVHAWDTFYVVTGPSAGYPMMSAAAEEQARFTLDKLLADRGLTANAMVRARTVPGAAAPVLLDAAAGADLVVLGTRGHGGFAGLLLGSVTHHLAHHAPCTVVVVP